MGRGHRPPVCVLLIGAVLLLVASCNQPLGVDDYGEILITLGDDAPEVTRGRSLLADDAPDYVSSFLVVISASDMETASETFDVATEQLLISVAAGPKRTVTLTAFTSDGLEAFSGSQEVDVEKGKRVRVEIDMQKRFENSFGNVRFHRDENPGFLAGAPSGIDYAAATGPAVTATGSAGIFTATVFWFADVTALTPSFDAGDGATVRVAGAVQESGESSQDFSTSVVYDVETPDGTTTSYTVELAKSIDLSGLADDIADAQSMHGSAEEGTDAGKYAPGSKAIFLTAIDAATAVATNPHTTPSELAAAQTALAGATTAFQAERVLGDSELAAFKFTAAENPTLTHSSYPNLADEFVGVVDSISTPKTVSVTVWWFADLTSMIPQFTPASGATVEVAGAQQTSGMSSQNFSSSESVPVVYTVVDSAGTTSTQYQVSVTHSADFSQLLDDIAAAQILNDSAVEGIGVGEYAVGSKVVFQNAIDGAQIVADNILSSPAQISAAAADLAAALNAFEAGRVKSGDVNVLIDWNAPTEANITFTEGTATLPTDQSMYVTAMLDGVRADEPAAGGANFQWFVDGVPTSDATARISMASADLTSLGLPVIGMHRATVTMTGPDGLPYSAEFEFAVVNEMVNDADAVAADAAWVTVGYSAGDDASAIKGDLALPTMGPNGTSISWDTNGHPAIASNGAVTRPRLVDGGIVGDIVATVSRNAASQDVSFTGLTVLFRDEQLVEDPDLGNNEFASGPFDMTDTHLAIGAWRDDVGGSDAGKVVIFEWDSVSRTWGNPYTIYGMVPGAYFGTAVAIDGDFLVVSARAFSNPAELNNEEGKAYVYQRTGPGNVWTTNSEAALVPNSAGTYDGYATGHFGTAVDIDLPYVVVGAREAGGPTPTAPDLSGRAYVYTQIGLGNRWDPSAELLVPRDAATPTVEAGAQFGSSVAIDGDTIVVGAPREDVGATSGAGRVYVYTNSGGNDWHGVDTIRLDVTLGPESPASGDWFGTDAEVSMDGTGVIAVGVPRAREIGGGTNYEAGAVYIFDGNGSFVTAFSADDTTEIERLGISLHLEMVGDTGFLVAGATDAFVDGTDSGMAYVFDNTSGSWSQTSLLRSPSPALYGKFGFDVAASPDGKIAISDTNRKVFTYE